MSTETDQPRYIHDSELALQWVQAEAMRLLVQNLRAIIAAFRQSWQELSTLGSNHMPSAAAPEHYNRISTLWQLTRIWNY